MECVVSPPLPDQCPGDVGRGRYDAFLTHPPPVFIWCDLSLSPVLEQRKHSGGVVGLLPGATIDARVMLGVEAGPTRISLDYLSSYSGMGMAALVCRGACVCQPQVLDGHDSDHSYNASTWQVHSFAADQGDGSSRRAAWGACHLRIRIMNSTSSGGFKFKLRSLRAVSSAGKA